MTEASETIARQVRDAVRETVSARRIQGAAGGGWTEKSIDQILFRGSYDIMRPVASYPSSVVHALMPSVVPFRSCCSRPSRWMRPRSRRADRPRM